MLEIGVFTTVAYPTQCTLGIIFVLFYGQHNHTLSYSPKLGSISLSGIDNNASLRQDLSDFNGEVDFSGLQHFTYNNSGFVDLLHGHLTETNFEGISVSI